MMELIKWSVADMRYINVYFGAIKQSLSLVFFCACPCFLLFFFCEDLATLTLYHTGHEQLALC